MNRIVIFLSLFLCLCAGCIKSKRSTEMMYDSVNDSFETVNTYRLIHADAPSDYEHLADFYAQRDRVVLPIFPNSDMGCLKLDTAHCRLYSLASGSDTCIFPVPFDLNAVTITAGTFRTDSMYGLSYQHRMTIPGWIVDSALVHCMPLFNQKMKEVINEWMGNSRVCKSWQAFADSPKANGNLMPFSDVSLELMMSAVESRSIKVIRQNASFSLFMPMTENDAAELTMIKNKQAETDPILNAFTLSPARNGLSLTLNLLMLRESPDSTVETDYAIENEKYREEYEKTVRYLRDKGVLSDSYTFHHDKS